MGQRWLAALIVSAVLAPGVAAAQPATMDQAMQPLVERAEAELAVGAHAIAHARALAVLGRVSASGSVGARARRVRDAAATQAAAQPEPSPDVVWEPLVIEAEGDATSGRQALATARLNAALAALPADSALATRARNLLTLSGRSGNGSTSLPPPPPDQLPPPPNPTFVPPPMPPHQPDVRLGTPPGPAQVTLQPVPLGTGGRVIVSPVQPETDGTRTAAELAELHAGAISLGYLTASWGMYLAGARDPLLYGTLPFLGSVALSLGVTALDQNSMPAGVPSSISTGMAAGFLNGLILWGAFAEDLEDCTLSVMGEESCETDGVQVTSLLVASSMIGTLGGALVGYGLRPTVPDNRFVASGALWGSVIMFFAALGLDSELSPTVWRMTSLGLNAGLALAVMTASVTDFRMARVAWITAFGGFGLLTGAMIGGMVYAVKARDGDTSLEPFWTALSIGAGSGVLLGVALPVENQGPSL